ncbi:response regulator [Paenibacillus motobuensis]|uniref:response regulator transcription factor n=1 Tax=Paenibacillus TaxID=44249 RepID=UPI002042057F|nr:MULTISPECIES: response regulator [Paenibacillus]MCM3041103.1 response regulator [Paenibacillus lutimineralis]MCM3648207.1 response regulator [Paenibacillus motobuensis]
MIFKVLLVDDEPGALEGMELWVPWGKMGFEICGTCDNGMEGLEKIRELKPDLVVTDVNMPIMGGLEMIKAWREQGQSEVSFVVVSGYSEFEYAQKAMHYGVRHYLLKPLIEEEAEKELHDIHEELMRRSNRQRLERIADYEETITVLRKLMTVQPLEGAEQAMIRGMSALQERWNICLLQVDSPLLAELRERTSSVISTASSMFLIDADLGHLAIIYGFNGSEFESNSWSRITEIVKDYKGQRIFVGAGLSQSSLLEIGRSYRTAKSAVKYKFYVQGYDGVLLYQDIEGMQFSHPYDQLQLMDTILRAVELMDQEEFTEAVDRAREIFCSSSTQPDIVKKLVAHTMYRIAELTGMITDISEEVIIEKYGVYEIAGSVLNLDELMGRLQASGMEVIRLLLQEQSQQAQGVIFEINQYIHEHYREGLTIKKLAEVFFLHPVYLGQLLIKRNGLSFNEMIHRLRIEEAVRLLGDHNYTNSEIAERVGYSSYGQFAKQFERRMGMSPNQYKNGKF